MDVPDDGQSHEATNVEAREETYRGYGHPYEEGERVHVNQGDQVLHELPITRCENPTQEPGSQRDQEQECGRE